VIRDLAALPDTDIRAMAHYLASFQAPATAAAPTAGQVVTQAAARAPAPGEGQRLFDSACGACHHDGDGPAVFGHNTPLALSSKLHSDRPDNLVKLIREGVRDPAHRDIGYMAGFADALDERQMGVLVRYMRARFAPERARW
jgi:nicotinate dehydrogenase subunit B